MHSLSRYSPSERTKSLRVFSSFCQWWSATHVKLKNSFLLFWFLFWCAIGRIFFCSHSFLIHNGNKRIYTSCPLITCALCFPQLFTACEKGEPLCYHTWFLGDLRSCCYRNLFLRCYMIMTSKRPDRKNLFKL
jgi:hypothetical protein